MPLARLADGRIYHLEFQSDPDSHMAWRMLGYFILIARRYGADAVVQQVLLVGERSGTVAAGIDLPNLMFRYDVIDFRLVDPALLLDSPAVEDNVLAFLCRCDALQERVRAIVRRLVRRAPVECRAAVQQLLLLSGLGGAGAGRVVPGPGGWCWRRYGRCPSRSTSGIIPSSTKS